MADVAAYRFIVFTHRYPVLFELRATADGQSMDKASVQAAAAVLPYLDRNRDQRIRWDEAATSRLMTPLMGGMQLPRGRQLDLLFRSYDTDADQTVDPNELVQFVNRGFSSRNWFVIRASQSNEASFNSTLARALDSNRDQQLDLHEMQQAPMRLAMLDADDDGIWLASEFADTFRPTLGGMEPGRLAPDERVFLLTDSEPDFGELLFRLQEKYRMGAPLLADELHVWPPAWQALDTDQDGEVWDHELAAIQSREADVAIRVRMGSKSSGFANSQMRVDSTSAPVRQDIEGACEIESGPDLMRFVLQPPGTRTEDDLHAMIERADSDADGKLSSTEFQGLQPLGIDFPLIDEDADGQLAADELDKLASIYGELALLRLELRLQFDADAIFAVIDGNRDGQLTALEVAASTRQLRQLDQNGDRRIQPDETESGFQLTLRLGGDQLNRTPQSTLTALGPRAAAPDAPVWFQAMDANHDGQIQRREFLGRLSDFELVDADDNGSLSINEAEQW